MSETLRALARHAGVVPSYTDQTKRRRVTRLASMRALLRAMGLPGETEAEAAETLAALRAEEGARPCRSGQWWKRKLRQRGLICRTGAPGP
jgi:hypothetical protein